VRQRPDPARPLDSLRSLASLRIGACLALLLEDSSGPARLVVRLAPALRTWPEGLREVSSVLPRDPALVDPLVWAFRLAVLLSLVGLGTEWSLLALSLLGAVLLPLAQAAGPTVHNHHLFWFLLLLTAAGSSSGAVWSLDAWRRREPWSTDQARRAKLAVAFGRALLGLVYFFPGYWKMKTSGLAWLSPAALTHLFHSKWYQLDLLPWLRPDRFPILLSAGAAGIVLLELSFPLLVLTARGRTLALIGGLSFHVVSAQLLGIAFAPLWLCYGLLVDWSRVDAWLRSEPAPPLARGGVRLPALRQAPLVAGIGVLACGGFILQGLRGQGQGWPWACYPTFQWIVPAEQRDVLATTVGSDSPASYPSPGQARRRSQREWGLMYRLLGAYGDDPVTLAEARCAYAQRLVTEGHLPHAHSGPTKVELAEVARPTAPERWDDPPTPRRVLARCSAL